MTLNKQTIADIRAGRYEEDRLCRIVDSILPKSHRKALFDEGLSIADCFNGRWDEDQYRRIVKPMFLAANAALGYELFNQIDSTEALFGWGKEVGMGTDGFGNTTLDGDKLLAMTTGSRESDLNRVLKQILQDLPQKRDWLDPALEREARALIKW